VVLLANATPDGISAPTATAEITADVVCRILVICMSTSAFW